MQIELIVRGLNCRGQAIVNLIEKNVLFDKLSETLLNASKTHIAISLAPCPVESNVRVI